MQVTHCFCIAWFKIAVELPAGVGQVPVGIMECLPDREAILVCHREIGK